MRKTAISFAYDSDKMEAIILFLLQKDMNLNTELALYLDQLYTKVVPANVRDFIAMREKTASEKPVRQPKMQDSP